MLFFRFNARFVSTRTVTGAALSLALLASGCHKQPSRAVPVVLVPTIETEPQPVPQSPQTTPIPTQQIPAIPPSTPVHNGPKSKPKPRKPVPRKPVPPEVVKPAPSKPNAPDRSVQITADVPRAAVLSRKQTTEQLLRNSESNLAHINRWLSQSEQEMLRQARNYITQSTQALHGGDIERAYNLAVKANLLSNELTK
ncbi:MAG: hypothetical protein CXZ00_10445 [Acidobacteria bacterium]|nr:MAG: hypothetical protein CXZ00_10445 [Acidobacteriota bacterium]